MTGVQTCALPISRRYVRVHFNKKRFETLVEREELIITSELPPKKKYKADHYKCAFCNHHQVCHLGAIPAVNCRTCKFSDLLPAGKWGCGKTGKRLSYNKQLRSEERRVGKECRCRWSRYHYKKKQK